MAGGLHACESGSYRARPRAQDFRDAARLKIGHSYDWSAILDYVPPVDFHGSGDFG
jgi:hypothetical protein